MELISSDTDRVRAHTSDEVLRAIDAETKKHVEACAKAPEQIDRRLRELEREWDVERWLEANASTLAFTSAALAWRDRRWLIVPTVVTAFLFQHAVQGWCPPLGVLRRLHIRTRSEIDAEKYALKALRGDFTEIEDAGAGTAAVESLAAFRR